MFNVAYAVYGALNGGRQDAAEATDASFVLNLFLNTPGATGVFQVGNNVFPDPSPGNTKHFGALVNGLYFACQEGQTINFSKGGGVPIGSIGPSTGGLVVKFAVYGALRGGGQNFAEAFDVTALLQAKLNATATVLCDDDLFGDPSPTFQKHFAAVVSRNGIDMCFACAEGQTIYFGSGGGLLQETSL